MDMIKKRSLWEKFPFFAVLLLQSELKNTFDQKCVNTTVKVVQSRLNVMKM